MTDVDDAARAAQADPTPPTDAAPAPAVPRQAGLTVSRRGALVGGGMGLAAVLSAGALDPEAAMATTPGATTTVAQPTTTAPEQLRLAWGADPTTQVTVSWSAPGSVAMPAPTLAYSTEPINLANPGTTVTLPAPVALSLAAPRTGPSATSFLDNLSGQTSYHYHVPLSGLAPDTTYYYTVSDGATPPSTASASFRTAPSGRAAYRFTAFGDIGTPYTGNPSGYTWTESSDVSPYTVDGVISPGDGKGAGLFHLMLADLSYANVNPANTPAIWRDYQVNASKAAMNQPWMPIQGNHEVEFGLSNLQGVATSGQYYNGPYGAGSYLARHLLPDNGLNNHDGTSLQGMFYKFQVGTVLFICLNTNDVVYQNPQITSSTAGKYAGTYNGGTIPTGTLGISQYTSTGTFTAQATNLQLVPNTASGTPNLQTQWLAEQLAAARAPGSSVDMIVVCEHHCALSTGPNNGVDLAIRAAWLPLYDEYSVDLVIGGHDHDYERSYPVRGYDAGQFGTATAAYTDAWGNTYAVGAPVNTRRPTVVQTTPVTLPSGAKAWNTAKGTVFLQLGGAGAAGGPVPATDPTTGLREAVLWATNTGVGAKQCATEDAPWSAVYDTSDNYGYAVFDVDPGDGPGQTTLTYQWYQVPTVPNGGTVTVSDTPLEEFVFTRAVPATTGGATAPAAPTSSAPGSSTSAASTGTGPGPSLIVPPVQGTPRVGETLSVGLVTARLGSTLTYQWLRDGRLIADATRASYDVVPADAGHALAVQVYELLAGYPPITAVSAPVEIAGARFARATPPSIHGTALVGRTLTAVIAAWTPGATFAFEWLLDGMPIPGAVERTLKLEPAYAKHRLAVRVTGRRFGYSAHAMVSPAVEVRGAVAPARQPRISGKALVGETLHALIGDWEPGTEFSYRWFVGGRPVPGATGHAFRVIAQYRGQRVAVQVTGRLAGHEPMSAVSAPTRRVRRSWTLL
jgi:hypothetical protein